MATNNLQSTNCIKCDLLLSDAIESYLVIEQTMTIISVITQWISPQILTDTDYICQSCWKLALQAINVNIETNDLDIDPLKLKTELPSSDNEDTETSNVQNAKRIKLDLLQPPDHIQDSESNDVKEEQASTCDEELVHFNDDVVHLKPDPLGKFDENVVNICHNNETTSLKEVDLATHEKNILSTNDNINNDTHNYEVETEKGIRRGCAICGCSILRRQNNLISREAYSELDHITCTIVTNAVTRQINEYDRICHKCWQKMRRAARKIINAELTHFTRDSTNGSLVEQKYTKEVSTIQDAVAEEPNDATLQSRPRSPDNDPEWIPTSHHKLWLSKNQGTEKNVESSKVTCDSKTKPSIKLSHYKRAPNTKNHCLFSGCPMKSLTKIRNDLRIELLTNQNYYVPPNSRICSFHLISNNWDMLFESNNSMYDFTSEHIEDIFSLLITNRSPVNFDNVMNIDDHLFQYWIGLTKEKFSALLNEVPEIQNEHRGLVGLAALLIKRHRGDTNIILSSLMSIPWRTLKAIMNKVNVHLTKRGEILEAFLPIKNVSRNLNNKKSETSSSKEQSKSNS